MTYPFDGLSNLQMSKLYDLLEIHVYNFKKNEQILSTINNTNIIGIVLEGCLQIINIEYNGDTVVLETLDKYGVFGTNISAIYIGNCEIISKQDSQILVFNYNELIKPDNVKYPYFNVFLQNLFNIVNIKYKKTNERIKVLEEKQIRNKLLRYFELEYKKSNLKYIYLPFSLKDLADYISVNRSAMFRELKHLREERFIEIKNRKITLLYKNNNINLDF